MRLRHLPLVDRHHEEAREEVLVAALHVLLRPLDSGAVVRRVLPIVRLGQCAAQRLEARARGNRSAADRLVAAGRRARGRRRRQCRFRGGGGRGWPQACCSHRLGWGHGHRLGWSCRFGERSGGGRCGWPRAAEQLVWPIVLLVVRHLGLGVESQLSSKQFSQQTWFLGGNLQRTRLERRGTHRLRCSPAAPPRGERKSCERLGALRARELLHLRAPRACLHRTSQLIGRSLPAYVGAPVPPRRPSTLSATTTSQPLTRRAVSTAQSTRLLLCSDLVCVNWCVRGLGSARPRCWFIVRANLRARCRSHPVARALSCRWSELLLPPLLGCASASPCALGSHPSGLQLPPCPSLPDSNGPQSHTRQRRTRKRRCSAARSSAATEPL